VKALSNECIDPAIFWWKLVTSDFLLGFQDLVPSVVKIFFILLWSLLVLRFMISRWFLVNIWLLLSSLCFNLVSFFMLSGNRDLNYRLWCCFYRSRLWYLLMNDWSCNYLRGHFSWGRSWCRENLSLSLTYSFLLNIERRLLHVFLLEHFLWLFGLRNLWFYNNWLFNQRCTSSLFRQNFGDRFCSRLWFYNRLDLDSWFGLYLLFTRFLISSLLSFLGGLSFSLSLNVLHLLGCQLSLSLNRCNWFSCSCLLRWRCRSCNWCSACCSLSS
jgi:hypothetical protein